MSYSWSRNCFCPNTLWNRVHRESLLCPQFVSSFAKRFPAQKCQSCHSIEAAVGKGNGRFCPSKTICRRIGPLSLKAFLACIFFTRLCRISSSLKLSGTFHSLFASKAEGPLYKPSCGLQINLSLGWNTQPYFECRKNDCSPWVWRIEMFQHRRTTSYDPGTTFPSSIDFKRIICDLCHAPWTQNAMTQMLGHPLP